MENATKALLIAGSVLVAILLIAMGVKIFNSTSETTQSSQAVMDTTAITTFNSQFAGYDKLTVSATKVNILKQKVMASNAVNKNHQIRGNILQFNATSGSHYISMVVDENTGYITAIDVDGSSNP